MSASADDAVSVDGAWAQSARLSFRFLFALVGIVALGWLTSNIRQIPSDSRALVYRFGDVARVQGAGLLIAWPRPIEEVTLAPAADRQLSTRVEAFDSVETRFRQRNPNNAAQGAADDPRESGGVAISSDPHENGGFLLTGDFSVVHFEATVFYQVSDPVAYAVALDHVEPALRRVFVAGALALSAGRDLDTVLVARPERGGGGQALAGREQLRGELVAEANKRLQALADAGAPLGVAVSRVDLTATLPTGAKSAFDAVLVATQSADREIAEARASAERASQNADQVSDRLLRAAQAAAREQVDLATTRTAAIAALSNEPGLKGDMLYQRLYNDRIGGVLAKAARVEAIDKDVGSRVILPGASK